MSNLNKLTDQFKTNSMMRTQNSKAAGNPLQGMNVQAKAWKVEFNNPSNVS